MRYLLATCLCFLFLNVFSQFTLSDNKRYLMRDFKPFFWLGDTAWELFHRLNREEATMYLKRRAEQGFTVIQAVALAEEDGLHVPNANGDLPLINDDPTKPNEAYFKQVDFVIDKAAEYGLVIAFLPTWGDKIWTSTWGKGPEIFNAANAITYGKWLGNRYKDKKNIIWILGGDRNPQNEAQKEIWRQMAKGITAGVGPSAKPIISFHPQPNKEGSGEYFYNEKWFSFNMFQNGHCRDTPMYDKIQSSYNRVPVKPVIDAEPIYEDHPVCFNAADLGISSAYDIRKYAYLDLFSGAFGHTYGCHDIWQFYSPSRPAINGAHINWQQALELPGANQMKILRRLIESHPITDRVPDQSLIVENNLPAAERIQATRGNDYAFIYASTGLPFTVNCSKISGHALNAYWLNPQTGEKTEKKLFDNKGAQKFNPPSSGYGKDWVLVLEDSKKFT